MRIYEVLFIIRPDVPEEEIDGIVEPLKGVVSASGGAVDKVDKWGKRRLAYRVKKYREGYYVLLQFSTEKASELVKELERRLRVSDTVIKFLTVRIDEELKRLEKLKKKREKRAARRPPPPQTEAPSSPAAQTPGAAPAAPAIPAEAAVKEQSGG
ncbi:MAG TPA: 30S ribosomal protein S6 [Bryobacterales bacterium]|nr:30S ribosomal protein S6 [Bryobacterales bacterium]